MYAAFPAFVFLSSHSASMSRASKNFQRCLLAFCADLLFVPQENACLSFTARWDLRCDMRAWHTEVLLLPVFCGKETHTCCLNFKDRIFTELNQSSRPRTANDYAFEWNLFGISRCVGKTQCWMIDNMKCIVCRTRSEERCGKWGGWT